MKSDVKIAAAALSLAFAACHAATEAPSASRVAIERADKRIAYIGVDRDCRFGELFDKDASARPDIGCYEMQDSLPGFVMMFR